MPRSAISASSSSRSAKCRYAALCETPHPPGHLAQGDPVRTRLARHREPGLHQRGPQVAVVVRRRAHAAQGIPVLTLSTFDVHPDVDTAHIRNPDASRSARKPAILATVCAAVLAINLNTTIVNIALPTLSVELDAGTRELLWFVDGYNLAFAALVLAAGSLSDRFGRRPALILGLLGFGLASAASALADSSGALVATRFALPAPAPRVIFPATLSIIANAFTERRERAAALGIWGAATGVGVAHRPVVGGWLLEHFAWQSVFWAMVPVARRGHRDGGRVRPRVARPARPAPRQAGDRRVDRHARTADVDHHRGPRGRLDQHPDRARLRRHPCCCSRSSSGSRRSRTTRCSTSHCSATAASRAARRRGDHQHLRAVRGSSS